MTFFEVLDSTVFLELMDPTDGRSHSTIRALALSKLRDNLLWELICAMISSGPIDSPPVEEVQDAFVTGTSEPRYPSVLQPVSVQHGRPLPALPPIQQAQAPYNMSTMQKLPIQRPAVNRYPFPSPQVAWQPAHQVPQQIK
ncbi:hypothetical protein C1H76_2971 [Elsinoe australis]|uniref:Uncharacterized protein n=1 Tax=Elsinoe australis TaxID=40998 RepID=A0A4U7B7M7_9PEZI|nr:hypothetical protein C1H76_2971 [Elsinoe australis]